MTHEEAFLEAILERPDDDAPRLIFADWLEDNGDPDRAEFIRDQIANQPMGGYRPYRFPDRAGELLLRNWDRWVAPLASLVSLDGKLTYMPWLFEKTRMSASKVLGYFPRGFVSEVTITASRFIAVGEAIFRTAAVTRLRLHGAGGLGAMLGGCRALRWIREVDFIDYFRTPIEAPDMASLARSPFLGRLATLRLHRNNLGDDGTRALASAGWLPGIEYLDLTENGMSSAGLRALTTSGEFRRIRVLRLDRNGFDDEAVGLLLDAPWLDRLEVLSLRDAGVSSDEADDLLARAPRLRLSIG